MTPNQAQQSPPPASPHLAPSHAPRACHTRPNAQDKPVYEPGQPFNPRIYRVLGLTPAEIVNVQPDLKPATTRVYGCLCALTEPETGICTTDEKQIAQKTSMSARSVSRALGFLKNRKFIRMDRNGPMACTFRFLYLNCFDLSFLSSLLKDSPKTTGQAKRPVVFGYCKISVQTPNDSVQGFADPSPEPGLPPEKEADNPQESSALKLLLQNRERYSFSPAAAKVVRDKDLLLLEGSHFSSQDQKKIRETFARFADPNGTAVNRLLARCEALIPGCTADSVRQAIERKGSQAKRAHNPAGLLIETVPEILQSLWLDIQREAEKVSEPPAPPDDDAIRAAREILADPNESEQLKDAARGLLDL